MSYIGNQPTSVAFPTDSFSGNGSTTVFTMTVAPANTASVLIFISGVKQDPSTYSVSGTTLTFSAAPPTGTSNISAIYLGVPASGVTTTAYRTVTTFTATAGQTTFSPPSYTASYINVFRNGVLLTPVSDYTATNGTTVVLATGATSGDTILVESFLVSSVLNAIPNTAGAVSDSNIVAVSASKLTGTQTIPWGTLPTGSVLQVINANTSTNVNQTTTTLIDTGLTATITPKYSTSKILVIVFQNGVAKNSATTFERINLLRNSTTLYSLEGAVGVNGTTSPNYVGTVGTTYLDSPATTSATIYKTQFNNEGGAGTTSVQVNGATSTITLMEIAA